MAEPQPFPGIPIRAPRKTPKSGEVIIRYEISYGKAGCCACSDLKLEGWVAVALLIFFFFPLAWLPCCIKGCHEQHQVPVYGPPSHRPATTPMPTAAPVAATPHHSIPMPPPGNQGQTSPYPPMQGSTPYPPNQADVAQGIPMYTQPQDYPVKPTAPPMPRV